MAWSTRLLLIASFVCAFTVLYCTVLYCTVLYCTALFVHLLYCTVLYCIVVFCYVLYCTVLQKPNHTKSSVTIAAQPENVTPQSSIKFLGVTLSDKLDFKPFLLDGKQNLYKQLKSRISAVKKMRKLIGFQFAKSLATATFMSKLSYAAEMWGGAPAFIIKKIQSLQLEMCSVVIGPISLRWNRKTLLDKLGWISIKQLLSYVSNKLTYRILHQNQPELLANRFRLNYRKNPNSTRLSGPNKLGPRPRNVGKTMTTRRQYRAQVYTFFN